MEQTTEQVLYEVRAVSFDRQSNLEHQVVGINAKANKDVYEKV